MKSFLFLRLASLSAVLACTGCGQISSFNKSASAPTQTSAVTANPVHAADPSTLSKAGGVDYAMDGRNCTGIAKNRLSLYDRPDTYPASAQEKQDAYQALFSACMREHNWQVAGPVHAQPAGVNVAGNAAQFASLSPAAGGNMARPTAVALPGAVVSSSSVPGSPGATVIVIGGNKDAGAPQLSSLSPSSGGAPATNPTVVLVQPQQAGAMALPVAVPVAAPYNAPPPPVAVPVPPLATAYAPMPHSTLTPPFNPPAAAPKRSAQAHKPKPRPVQEAHASPRAPHPSLASAESDAAGGSVPVAQALADRQLETVLEK